MYRQDERHVQMCIREMYLLFPRLLIPHFCVVFVVEVLHIFSRLAFLCSLSSPTLSTKPPLCWSLSVFWSNWRREVNVRYSFGCIKDGKRDSALIRSEWVSRASVSRICNSERTLSFAVGTKCLIPSTAIKEHSRQIYQIVPP